MTMETRVILHAICSLSIIIFLYNSTLFPQNSEWIKYTENNYITSLADNGNFIWAGTTEGLLKINKGTHGIITFDHSNSELPVNSIYSLLKGDSGSLWIGTNGGGLVKYDGIHWTIYDTINSEITNNIIYTLAKDDSGNIWIGTYGSGLLKFDGISWQIYNTSNSGLPDNLIYSLSFDRSGNLWVGTATDLTKFDGSNWINYPALSRDGELAILPDNSGNVWIGTGGAGLIKYDGSAWTTYAKINSGLSSDWVRALASDQAGNLWIGTWGGGLVKYDNIYWTVYTSSNSDLPYGYINSIMIDTFGNKWIGTYGNGLAVFNEGGVVSVDENNNEVQPEKLYLLQNYPNPFNPVTKIKYSIPFAGTRRGVFVHLIVYDVLGNEITTLVNEDKPAGTYEINWNADNFPDGIYFCNLIIGDYLETKKMILLK